MKGVLGHDFKRRKSKRYYMWRCCVCGVEARPSRYGLHRPDEDTMDKKDRGVTCSMQVIRQVHES
jgi:hypothetical protein